ncbi:MAG: hypothetical protein V4597_17775 [Pseudomonadota bacterium]
MPFIRSAGERRLEAEAERRDVLRSRGVPEAFVENLATRREGVLGFAGGIIFLIPLLAAIGMWWLVMNSAMRMPWRHVVQIASDRGAWLYSATGTLFWIGLIGSLFAVILVCGWLFSLPMLRVAPHPGPSSAASALRTPATGSGEFITDWIIRKSAIHARDAATPEDFLRTYARHQVRGWGVVALVVAGCCAAAIAAGSGTYWLAGPSGLERHDLFTQRSYAWTDATRVIVGCSETDSAHRLIYEVHTADWSVDLGSESNGADIIRSRDRLSSLERIDAILRSAKLPHELWRWRDRDPRDRACIAHWAKVAGDPTRIDRLLATP